MATEDADLDALTDAITTLCGHLDAAEYRLLELIRQLDERAPWGLWEVKSCAHWLNWKCGIDLGAAREKVRVAHALADLPLVSDAFRSGRLSYSKVRAITRIANAENEALLIEMGLSATAAQIEKIVRKYRQVERLEAADAAMAVHANRSLTVYWAEDGSLVLNGRLTPEQGAVLVEALEWVEVETPFDEPSSARRADALMARIEGRGQPVQVTVHVSAETLSAEGSIDREDPPRIEDGPVLAPDTVRRLACDSAVVPILEAGNGEPLSIGRRTRVISPALRRALQRRDGGCAFPGCTNTRYVDAHHIQHWADGGETSLGNLVLLCRHHHRLIHEGGFTVERTDRGITFNDPQGICVPVTAERRFCGNVVSLFDAQSGLGIDARTTTPAWYGERVDYDHVLWVMRRGE
jgi:hypothetical protein